MSADAGRKLLIKVLLRIGKMYLAIASDGEFYFERG